MATPPIFAAEYECADWTTTGTPKTASVTVTPGDTLAIYAGTEDSTITLSTPTGGGLTYSLLQSITTASHTTAYLWTATATSVQTYTLSVACSSGTARFGFDCLRFAGTAGAGASNSTTGTGGPSLGLTTTGDNSTVVAFTADWAAVDGTTRTWRTVNTVTPTAGNGLETTYARDSIRYTVYGAYWNDVGSAGAKTVGVSAPVGQTYSIVAVEILGVGARLAALGTG